METHNDSHFKTLTELTHEEVTRQIPLMIYLIVLCLSGIVGNCLVLYIFTKKYSHSTFRTFVIILAAVDLFTSSVVIPLELLQFAWQYTYDNALACKLNLFVKTWTTITSSFLLLCISIDRFRRICRPFDLQISLRAARNMCIGSALFGVAFSWISPVMYSVQTTELSAYNLTVWECAITESMKRTQYPLVNNVSLAILFVGALVGIAVIYSFIAVRVKKQMKKQISNFSRRENTTQTETDKRFHSIAYRKKGDQVSFDCDTTASSIGSDSAAAKSNKETNLDTTETEEIEKYKSASTSTYTTKQAVNRKITRKNTNRTTMIMFMISLAFIISYLPFLCVRIIQFADKTFTASLTDSERAVYKFVHRSYFLNCAVNPLIYGLWDIRFRKACRRLFTCRQER